MFDSLQWRLRRFLLDRDGRMSAISRTAAGNAHCVKSLGANGGCRESIVGASQAFLVAGTCPERDYTVVTILLLHDLNWRCCWQTCTFISHTKSIKFEKTVIMSSSHRSSLYLFSKHTSSVLVPRPFVGPPSPLCQTAHAVDADPMGNWGQRRTGFKRWAMQLVCYITLCSRSISKERYDNMVAQGDDQHSQGGFVIGSARGAYL